MEHSFVDISKVPVYSCSKKTYANIKEARKAKREYKIKLTNIYYCYVCCGYHLIIGALKKHLPHL